MDLNNFFVCALIYVMIAQFLPKSQVWKRVWFLEVYSNSGVENYNFFCLKAGGQDSKNWAAHLHQEFPGVPPPRFFSYKSF